MRCLLLLSISLLAACGDSTLTPPTGAGGEGGAGGDELGGFNATVTSGMGGDGGAPDPTAFANAGRDLEVETGAPIELNGFASSSEIDTELSFQWTQTAGPLADVFSADSGMFYGAAPQVPGTLTFSLVVEDSTGPSAADDVSVVVHNRLPAAHAGPDLSALEGEVVTLVGAGFDPEADVITFTWTQVSGPAVDLDDPTSVMPTLTVPPNLSEPLVYQLVVHDPYEASEPDWVTVRRVNGPDSDDDLLDDAEEAALGTDPSAADSDGDGVPDSWEVLGHEGVDYPSLGCDPRHRDLLIELDYQDYVDGSGAPHTAAIHPRVLTALETFYSAMPLDNPDGTQGVDLHVVLDSTLAGDFVCNEPWSPGDWSPPNFLYREAFHKVALCNGSAAGFADIGGRNIWLTTGEPNADPSDDATEEVLFDQYRLFIHEMGHNFDLQHGGSDGRNYKVNYPSVMNYGYGYTGLVPGPGSLDAPDMDFSHGLLPPLDECALVEHEALAGTPPQAWAPLAAYSITGLVVEPDGSVDFDEDGTISDQPYELIFADGNGQLCGPMLDHDDFAIIDPGIAGAIEASRSVIPFASWARASAHGAP